MIGLIGPLQSSFILGQGTSNNTLITQEIVHHMRKKTSREGYLMFKINFEKAYDKVDGDFLELTLTEFGFLALIIHLIMNNTRATSLSLKWDNEVSYPFFPTRSLRKGDPLSPYLFVFCMEKLTTFIQEKVQSGSWHPVPVSRERPKVSHLFFANDNLLWRRRHLRFSWFWKIWRILPRPQVFRSTYKSQSSTPLRMLPGPKWINLETSWAFPQHATLVDILAFPSSLWRWRRWTLGSFLIGWPRN